MGRALLNIPPRFYRTTDGKQFVIRHVKGRSARNTEWMDVRERLVAKASSLPQVLEVASNPLSSVIFVAIDSTDEERETIIGYVVVNVSFIAARAVSIAWISVSSRFRGRSVGRSLLHYVDSFCRANTVNHVEAMRTDGVTKLFKNCGFRLSNSAVILRSKVQRKDVQQPGQAQVPQCITDGTVVLRLATPEDRKGWSRCILEGCNHLSGCNELIGDAFSADFRVSAFDRETNRIVGVVSIDVGGWIPLILCLQQYRGQGLGSFMMFVAMEWLRQQGGSEVRLTPLNTSVTNFYKRWSFVEDKKTSRKRRRADEVPILVRKFARGECLLPEGRALEDFLHPAPQGVDGGFQAAEGD